MVIILPITEDGVGEVITIPGVPMATMGAITLTTEVPTGVGITTVITMAITTVMDMEGLIATVTWTTGITTDTLHRPTPGTEDPKDP